MTQIIAAIVGAVALILLCECCYTLGRIQGKNEGIEECTEMLEEHIREAEERHSRKEKGKDL